MAERRLLLSFLFLCVFFFRSHCHRVVVVVVAVVVVVDDVVVVVVVGWRRFDRCQRRHRGGTFFRFFLGCATALPLFFWFWTLVRLLLRARVCVCGSPRVPFVFCFFVRRASFRADAVSNRSARRFHEGSINSTPIRKANKANPF